MPARGDLIEAPKTTGFPRCARAADVRRGFERRGRRIEPAALRGPVAEGRGLLVVPRVVLLVMLMGCCHACSVLRRRHGRLQERVKQLKGKEARAA